MPPNDNPTVYPLQQAMTGYLKCVELILLGDLNVRLQGPRDKSEEDLAKALVDWGLVNMTAHTSYLSAGTGGVIAIRGEWDGKGDR